MNSHSLLAGMQNGIAIFKKLGVFSQRQTSFCHLVQQIHLFIYSNQLKIYLCLYTQKNLYIYNSFLYNHQNLKAFNISYPKAIYTYAEIHPENKLFNGIKQVTNYKVIQNIKCISLSKRGQ